LRTRRPQDAADIGKYDEAFSDGKHEYMSGRNVGDPYLLTQRGRRQ